MFNNTSHMTVTSSKPKCMRVADTVRRFYHLLLWRREFYFDVVGNVTPIRKLLRIAMHLAKSVITYIRVS